MNRVWPALAVTYIGSACLQGCTNFDDRGLFTPTGELDGSIGSGGEGGASTSGSTAATTSTTTTGTTSTGSSGAGATTTSATTSSSASATTGSGGATSGTGGSGEGGRASGGAGGSGGRGEGGSPVDGGSGAGGRSGAGGSTGGGGGAGARGGAGGNAGSTVDASVPKVCVDLHTAANTAKENAMACMQAGSFTECHLVQDECGCGVGVRTAATQAVQRYQMAVQSLRDSGCFDACPDAKCPPYTGVKCTPGAQSRLQCIAY